MNIYADNAATTRMSDNTHKICQNLPNKDIFFIPDQNLARYIANKLPEKKLYF